MRGWIAHLDSIAVSSEPCQTALRSETRPAGVGRRSRASRAGRATYTEPFLSLQFEPTRLLSNYPKTARKIEFANVGSEQEGCMDQTTGTVVHTGLQGQSRLQRT